MKKSVKFKDYKHIQKIGYILMIIASVMTLANILNIFKASHFVEEDLRSYIFLAGGLLVMLPYVSRWIKGKNSHKKTTVFLLMICTSFCAMAQDYSKQIEAFSKSLSDKSIEAIQPYLSTELKFGNIPVANTPAIMNNIVKNLPKVNSMTIIKNEAGKAKVAYDFVGLGKSESYIYFDNNDKIVKIQLIEDLINQEAEARRQQKVPLPTPGELGDKYVPKEITFAAPDELAISGNLYEIGVDKPIILLLHQAGYNRMEYTDIAPRLNELGYNCLAIDLRSGGDFAGKPNQTNARAMEKGTQPEMFDAQQDITAAVDYLNKKYNKKVIVWGSSFSSSLALLEGLNNKKIKAVIGFSPGDYFENYKPSLTTVFSAINKPYLVTSSKAEATTLKALIGDSEFKKNQQQFIPQSNGFHGSRALWNGQDGGEEYWIVVKQFLSDIK